MDTPVSDLIVMWLESFLVRKDEGWGYLALESGLLELFLIRVFVRIGFHPRPHKNDHGSDSRQFSARVGISV